jgi:DNA-binding HxlR family transcriptional regulator
MPAGRAERFGTLESRVEAVGEQPGADSASASEKVAPVEVCPDFHAAIELIGRRWAGAILWALGESPHYFAELTAAVPGLSDRLLSRRLRELESAGLVQRSVEPGTPPRVSYALTRMGRELVPVMGELREWARAWNLSS